MDIRGFTTAQLAQLIQYTNVNPDLTRDGIVAHLQECVEHNFHAAMISPCWIKLARDVLRGTRVRIATTVNFPQATDTPEMKAAVIPLLKREGADEFDFPPNPAFLLSGMEGEYVRELSLIAKVAHENGLIAKAMLEFGYLPNEALRARAATFAAQAGIDWVKNSSGWGKGGSAATPEDTHLLREAVAGTRCRVKVSGKVNSLEKLISLCDAGAELCGTSSGVAILKGKTGDARAY